MLSLLLSTATAAIAVVAMSAGECHAKSLSQARADAIGWLEANQNEDGSWGSGEVQTLTTAEALLALALAGRGQGTAARRAQVWLLNREFSNLDYQARTIRALESTGVDMSEAASALDALGSTTGWGPVSSEGVTSFDTALVLAAIRATGSSASGEAAKVSEILARQRPDAGWSGDGVVEDVAPSASDRTVSSEIVRALSAVYAPGQWTVDPSPQFSAQRFLSTDIVRGGAAVDSSSDTLELASRLAALHAVQQVDDDTSAGLETELLQDARFAPGGAWSDTDAYVNALGLLAVTTKPSAVFTPLCPNDSDCDGVVDAEDPFPFDASEWSDLDGDGVGDNVDRDRDGDGYCDLVGDRGPACTGVDAFETDPTESADLDGDGIGDNEDPDDDNDGIPDLDEIEAGTDPALADSDGDGSSDAVDECPLFAGGTDVDGDGVCAPVDECDNLNTPLAASSWDIWNLDGDDLCDEADPDDDGDGFPDGLEVIAGSDPRDASSVPVDLAATDPDGDFDGDGLSNEAEVNNPVPTLRTNPYLADSDLDGSLDGEELGAAPTSTDPNDPASHPAAKIAVLSSAGAAELIPPVAVFPAEMISAGVRSTATGGQPTPVATLAPAQSASQSAEAVSLAGFQPQTTLGRDFDGDGLTGAEESELATSHTNVDSDGDRFVDGLSGLVAKTRYANGFDLDGDGFVEGEGSLGTDPASSEDHAGKPGDVAPLGFPDAQINAADVLVEMRLAEDPALSSTLSADAQELTDSASDVDEDGDLTPADILLLIQQVQASGP